MFRKFVKAIIPGNLFRQIEPFGHLCESVLANVVMGFPARGLNVIGVTGTDGKTTTSTLIYTMLNESGVKTGLMTTIGYGTPGHWQDNYVHMTTVSIWDLLRRIKELRAQGIEWLVLETTSHALAQNRVWGIPYQVAVMTNITHEHLDYHQTFERYRDAKRRLFQIANRHGLRAGVINGDDPSAKLFASDVSVPIIYGLSRGDLSADRVKLTPNGSQFELVFAVGEGQKRSTKTNRQPVSLKLPGEFNVYNALAAGAVGDLLGLDAEQISAGLGAIDSVEGRMNAVEEGQDFSVVVDFAHTPDSFEKILSGMRQLTKGRLIVVFGSAGRRDEAKRAIQGASAGKWADLVVITEEDDRDIDGGEIMNQIAEGAEKAGKTREKDLFLIGNRSDAIRFAIDQAKQGDTVMLLGKGHEKTIERADGEHPWDELEEARQAIKVSLKKR